MGHIEWKISVVNQEKKDLLIARLCDLGIQGMEETQDGLNVYAEEDSVDSESIDSILKQDDFTYEQSKLESQNWNVQWESYFEPVMIPGQVHVRAHFHPPMEGFIYDLLITPKMSFGTGHHATTRMMMRIMLDMNFSKMSVIDFGTGTGILAILAEKMGADAVWAIDNDLWSIENTRENAAANLCSRIEVSQAENLISMKPCQVLLANINKNVLLENVSDMKSVVQPQGYLVISGLLSSDYDDILNAYLPYFGQVIRREDEGEWMALLFHNEESNC